MTWFETLTGFRETSATHVRENLTVEGDVLKSRANAKQYTVGRLETPTLADLRRRADQASLGSGRLDLGEVIANVQDLHASPTSKGALFQVASQFNLLEMVHPGVTPDQGVGIYENDRTQGPACAIAAGAGTIYRNYFAEVDGQIGQSAKKQIDCLADLGARLGNTGKRLWSMQNGYALASRDGLIEISKRLRGASEVELEELRGLLRIGVQWNTQVTIRKCVHTVTQAYCSALPVAYSEHSAKLWDDFARFILEASYEATICAAIINAQSLGTNRVFLTLLGGGAFGNAMDWILAAIKRACVRYRHSGLDVSIVSYSGSNPHVQDLINELQC